MKVMLALVEAFDNVMTHAYPRARHKPVLIGFHVRGKRLQIDVMDKGRGISKMRHDLPGATKESGRGLYLIYRLAKQVQSQREGGWHRLRMSIPLGK
jgi:anti-sigma regulatory factor (Ser/Thr protein kinase)